MTTQDAVPASPPDNSGNVIITTIRYVLIGVATMSLVGLSIHALGLQYSDVFVNALRNLKDLIGWTQLFEFLERLIKLVAAYVGFPNLRLGEWWRDTFVLLWLFNGSIARNMSHGRGWGYLAWITLWGGSIAFAAAIATGMVPLNSLAMSAWSFAGFCAFFVGDYAWELWHRDEGEKVWRMPQWWFLLVTAAMVITFAIAGFSWSTEAPSLWGVAVPSPSLLMLGALVLFFGVLFTLAGLILAPKLLAVGRDIVIAFVLATVMAIIGLLM